MNKASFDLGKKVFFLNPPKSFQDSIIPLLSTSGYEIYCIPTYKQAKPILRKNPNSVFYVYIDAELNKDQWYNFISSFSDDEAFSQIIIGIMSTHADQNEVDHFLLNASIPGGFISLSQLDVIIHDYIHSILHLNDAKGKRNFVRANCQDEKSLSAENYIKGRKHSFKVINISSAGLLCSTSSKLEPLFPANKVLNDILINLNGRKILCNMLTFKTYVEGDSLFLVLLFATDIPFDVKLTIDMYVRSLLQRRIEEIIKTLPLDTDDYIVRQKSAIGQDTNDAFLISVEDKSTDT